MTDAHAQHQPEHAHGSHCAHHAAPPAPPGPVPEGAIWTCPMHPQIRQDGPGTCPICGMALEPEAPSLDDAPNPELVDFTRRLWVAGLLSVPLLVLSMGAEMLGLTLLPPAWSAWAQLALTAPIVLWAGLPFFERGWTSLRTRHLNMFTLIAIGVGAAFLYSLVATIAPGIFPMTFHTHGMGPPVYYEAAGIVVTLVLLGQVLELRARAATGKAIRALMKLAPKTARRIAADGSESEIELSEVHPGDRAAHPPGRGSAGRRRDDRGPVRGRRIDADRRADADREKRGRGADRRDRQRHRQPGDGKRRRSAPTRCWRGSCAWWPRRSAAARRSRPWRTGCRAGSCRAWCWWRS